MSAAASSHAHAADVACPDPSVHSRLSRDADLQNNASRAALLAAESKRTSSSQSSEQRIDPLGPDGRLSSGAAASSLKYAKAQDLPSFPSVGIDATQSGNKAANLANTNYKSPAYPHVDSSSSSASKAATLAANKGGHLDLWQYKPEATSNSAAHLAMGKNLGVELDRGYTEDGHKKALLAATLSTRKKNNAPPPVEEPPVYPDSGNASYNALNAASVAHRPSTKYQPLSDKGLEASRIYHQQPVSSAMYGSAPPVAIEEDEKRHQAALHAAAVSAAKNLYEIEKPAMERIAAGDPYAKKAYDEAYTATPGDDRLRMQAMNYIKVQEAAQKLAAERLAKLDPDGARAYRDHYGVGPEKPTAKLSVRGSRRGNRDSKATNDDLDSSDDEAQASRIRGRTNRLNEQVASIDEQKRSQDRKDLMAAAQAKVQARMSTMDEQVFNSTGKMSPAMAKEWEAKARAKAEADSTQRMATHGKVHIGGGRYMDQSEVDAIAQERMQPTLDEITRTAAAQRAREEEIALNEQRRKEEAQAEKQRQAEVKANTRMLDAQEKARLQGLKDAEKAEQKRVREADKDAARTRAAEEKAQKDKLKQEEREAKERERLNEATLRTAQRDTERANAAEKKAELEADKARAAEAEAAEKEADAERRAAEAEAAKAAKEEAKDEEETKRSTEVTSPDITDAAEVTSGEPTTMTEDTPTDPTTNRRESKLRGFFSKMRSPKKGQTTEPVIAAEESPEAIAAAEKYKSGTGEGDKSAELSARARGKQPADPDAASSISSLKSSEVSPTRGRESTVSDDKWSEARDTIEEPPPRVSSSPARGSGSKFQEDL